LVAPARDAVRFLRNPLPLLRETAARGDLSWFRVGPRRFYLVNDLDLIDEVLATRHGPLRRQGGYEEGRFAGDSLFSEEEPVHAERRGVLEPVFDREAIESYGAWMGRRATEFAQAWPDGGGVRGTCRPGGDERRGGCLPRLA
ncbi:MAG: cytochrome P450, partial [Actinomycetota bacterium]|nr:cytochrome P450 [Actinomycetota bacterium]